MDEDEIRELLGLGIGTGIETILGLAAGGVAGLPGIIAMAATTTAYKHMAEEAAIEAENRAHTFKVLADAGRAERDPEFTPPASLPDPSTVLRNFEEIFSGSVAIGLDYADRESVDFMPQKDASLAAQAMNMGPEEFLRWTTMARPVAYGSNRDPGEVITDMTKIWSGPGQELDVAARAVDVITDDLDALDRMALGANHPAMRAILNEAQNYAPYTSGFNQPFAEVDGPWADYRKQGQVPRQTDEGLARGAWSLEQSMADTRDWTSGLPATTGTGPEWSQGAGPIWDPAYGVPFWTSGLPDATGAGPEWSQDAGPMWDPFYEGPGSQLGQVADELQDFQNTAGGELNTMGNELEHTANSALRMQDAVGGASFELWELEHPLLQIRDVAINLADTMGSGYGGDGVTGAMDHAGFAADGLALSTGTAEQALLAAGLTGDSTTQVLDLMRRAGLDPATSAWGELAAAVHVWGDATDTEVDRVIGRLGELARVQGGGGPGSGGSGSSGGGSAQAALSQLMSLAYRVAVERADMGDLNPQHRAHELGKVLGQLGAPGSVAEKLALLRLFFAGSAHGLSFGLGPSASSLGFDIPQFAGGGTVPGPLGAPQLILAHGGEHIVPHRATGSPTIIRIELDREVLSQAVLGDLLRLQGREVTLGLS